MTDGYIPYARGECVKLGETPVVRETVEIAEDTKSLYTEEYFQGGQSRSNYNDYYENSRGPSIFLAETLFKFFRPRSALDGGCAVGHTVKALLDRGVHSFGIDISEWAVAKADHENIRQLDFSQNPISGSYDLVYSYDVLEHVLPSRLDDAIRNLWAATERDLLVVPAIYNHGETFDPNEPTHLIFETREWWIERIRAVTGAKFDDDASERFAQEEHSKIFHYSDRIIIFSRA